MAPVYFWENLGGLIAIGLFFVIGVPMLERRFSPRWKPEAVQARRVAWEECHKLLLEEIDKALCHLEKMCIRADYIFVGGGIAGYLGDELIKAKFYRHTKLELGPWKSDVSIQVGDSTYDWHVLREQPLPREAS